MKICKDNPIKEIKNIVQNKAKYQKVMLLFDDSVSNVEIGEIYMAIKDFCIYNQSNIKEVDENEIYNGYRLVVFYCMVDSFLKCKINTEEFVCVFFPKDNSLLPYFLSKTNEIDYAENYLLIENTKVDLSMKISIHFNQFYNYFKNLISGQNQTINYSQINQEITQYNVLNCIKEMPKDSFFLDVDILKKEDISYEDIIVVDLLLINAFLLLITSIKQQSFMLVDVYKSARDDTVLIEKFYKLFNNETLTNLIILNYNCLHTYCNKTKQRILEFIGFFNIENNKVENIIKKIKNYSKNDNDLPAYLYLYNIFDV